MIRFVDIRGQGTGYRFAFWDTVRDRFLEFGGDQAWEDKEDFLQCFGKFQTDLDMYIGLMPEWASIPMTDDEPL